ncbi:MAG: glycoside hydrolase N-terminal domain-containing protein [Bacteroidales bacterium]|nr:glycoside hydrolase N-terminal domain-containing protein [Bacteroidales bacterium]
MKKSLLVLTAFLVCAGMYAQDKLWYDTPAEAWLEALPLGNSNIGAMVFGGVQEEVIGLNEETFWSGGPHNNNATESLEHLDEVRQLIFDGRESEAGDILNQYFIPGPHGMKFLTMGNLRFKFPEAGEAAGYYRDLDLNTATASVRYSIDGVNYSRKAFASLPEKILVLELDADKKGALSFDLSYDCIYRNTVAISGNRMTVLVDGEGHEGIDSKLTGGINLVVDTDGEIEADGSVMKVRGARKAVVRLSAATNFVRYDDVSGDPYAINEKRLAAADRYSYKKLLKRHVKAYKKQYDQVSLELPSDANASLRTDKRLEAFAGSNDMGMVALMFNYGRYLLISSSQEGGQPANLQGLWNAQKDAPWDSKYTININAEMNYWPAEVSGLSSCAEPLWHMTRDLSETGAITARQMYGCNGWVAHHNTDLWRIAGPVDAADWGIFPAGGAWLATHLWEHYLFTEDKEFLKEYYPVMKGAADFFLDYMRTDPNTGYLVVVPSTSPEHGPVGKKTPVCAGTTMDNQIVGDILRYVAEASEILGLDAEDAARYTEAASKLPPMKVGQYGQLQEWQIDGDDPHDQHRHISHLYGLYPSAQISPFRTPEFFDACRVTLEQRGDMATGWSLGWKTNFWARMLDGNHAFKIISNMFTLLSPKGNPWFAGPNAGRTYPNLFDAHPPFQIDGNFGACAGIAEMLVQSHDGAIHILPALPDAWPQGKVKGFRVRGNASVDFEWADGKLVGGRVHAKRGSSHKLRSYVPLKGRGLENETFVESPCGISVYEYDFTGSTCFSVK